MIYEGGAQPNFGLGGHGSLSARHRYRALVGRPLLWRNNREREKHIYYSFLICICDLFYVTFTTGTKRRERTSE